jgi:hypothetical protein
MTSLPGRGPRRYDSSTPRWAVRAAAEFARDRVTCSRKYTQTIRWQFGDNTSAIVEPFEAESHGMPMLQCLCDAVFAADAKPTSAVKVR